MLRARSSGSSASKLPSRTMAVTSGACPCSSRSARGSRIDAAAGRVPIAIDPDLPDTSDLSESRARAKPTSMSRACWMRHSPALVGTMPRGSRSKRRTPRPSSISASALETAGWVTCNASATRPRFRCSSSATSRRSCRSLRWWRQKESMSIPASRHTKTVNPRPPISHWITAARRFIVIAFESEPRPMSEIVNFVELSNYYGYADPSYAEAADGARIDMRFAHGKNVSLAVATCQPGYHPAAQIHSSEQINYIAEGELWVYVDGSAYHLKEGDAIRIPSGATHWMWNRSDAPCTFYESNCPPLAGQVPPSVQAGRMIEASRAELDKLPRIVWLAEKYSREVEEKNLPPVEGPLMARADSLATSVHGGAIGAAAAGKLTSKCVHGLHHNMTIARRKGSYHSAPHIHDAEQLHFVVSGDIDIYRDDCGFSCKPGDFNIIPRNTPHWAHVTSDD